MGVRGGVLTGLRNVVDRAWIALAASGVAVVALAATAPAAALATEPPTSVTPPTIEGEATVDSPLNGKAGEWGGTTPITFTWQWLHCDAEGAECEPILGAEEQDREVRDYDLGGTLRLKVTASNKWGSASKTSAATAVVVEPEAPANTEAPSLTGTMKVGETLIAGPGKWTHFPQSFEFQWQACDVEGKNCEDIEGATGGSLILPAAVEGDRVRALVTAENRGGEDTAATLPGAIVGPMVAPANTKLPSLSPAEESRQVRSNVGTWSGGRPLSFSYQWLLCDSAGEECTEIPGATKSRYTPTAEQLGESLRVEVTATNAAGSPSATSKQRIVDESAPWFSGWVEIEGELKEEAELGVDLSALRGSEPMSLDYEWQRCFERCEEIDGATDPTYVPTEDDRAHRLRVKVTATNWLGEEFSTSSESDPVVPAETEGEPRAAEFPVLDGVARDSETLTTTHGKWVGAGEITTSVLWQRCFETEEGRECEEIEGETEDTYDLGPADVGTQIRSIIVAENEEEAFEEARSALTAPILPQLNTVITIDGEIKVDKLLQIAEEANAPVVSLEWDADGIGVYIGGIAGTGAKAVSTKLNQEPETEPKKLNARSMTLSGDFNAETLWSLSPVKTAIEHAVGDVNHTPSIPPSRDPEPESGPEEEPPFPGRQPQPEDFKEPEGQIGGDPDLTLPIISWATIQGAGWDCLGDACEEFEGFPGSMPREIWQEFDWGIPREDMYREIVEKAPLALEFDLKLINHQNSGGLVGLNCSDSEVNDFWVTKRDDVIWDTTIHEEAGFYWDTDLSDDCTQKDLTFGIYHPENMLWGERYDALLQFNHAGNKWVNDVVWQFQLLQRLAHPCDFSPWCVNVPPANDYKLTQVVIPEWYHWDFPRCYQYEYRAGIMGVEDCHFPV